jgi:hypothetical protein
VHELRRLLAPHLRTRPTFSAARVRELSRPRFRFSSASASSRKTLPDLTS